MEQSTLTSGENFFLNVYRSFSFLRKMDYEGKDFYLGEDREGVKYLTFYRPSKSQYVTVMEREDGSMDLIIRRKGLLTKNISYIETTKLKHTGVSYFSKIIQGNKDFMGLL